MNEAENLKNAFTWAAVILAFASAGLWFAACFVGARYKPIVDADGGTDAAIISDGQDVIRTAKRQLKWNAWAAAVAGLATICQGVTLLP
jgi:hypothetical protein